MDVRTECVRILEPLRDSNRYAPLLSVHIYLYTRSTCCIVRTGTSLRTNR